MNSNVHSIRLGNFRNYSCSLGTMHSTQIDREKRIDKIDQYLPGRKSVQNCVLNYVHRTHLHYMHTQCEKGGNWQRRTINYRNNQIIFSSIWKWCIYVHVSYFVQALPQRSSFRYFELVVWSSFVHLVRRYYVACSMCFQNRCHFYCVLIRFSKCISQNIWCSTNKVFVVAAFGELL